MTTTRQNPPPPPPVTPPPPPSDPPTEHPPTWDPDGVFFSWTTESRDAIVDPTRQMVIYNSDDKELQVWNGSYWQSLTLPGDLVREILVRMHLETPAHTHPYAAEDHTHTATV